MWGDIGYIATGAAGAFPATNPSDVLVDLIYALKAGYRQNAVFVMNRKTQAQVRKFKDGQGNYLLQPPAVAGGRASLMSFDVVEAEDMPDVAANSLSVAFGDFGRGYLVVDRQGVTVLRDRHGCLTPVLPPSGWRRRAGLRRDQTPEVRSVVTRSQPARGASALPFPLPLAGEGRVGALRCRCGPQVSSDDTI